MLTEPRKSGAHHWRWNAVAMTQLGCVAAIGALLWSVLCVTPAEDWNSARLLPAALLGAGEQIYFSPNEGPALGWIYGPVMPLLMSPASWLPDLTALVVGAALLNACVVLAPLLVTTGLIARRASMAEENRRWLLVAVAAAAIGGPWTGGALRFLHVDAMAVGLAVLSCWCLVQKEEGRVWIWLAAVFAVLAVWTKQLAVGVPVAQLIWLGWTQGAPAARRYLMRFVVAGLTVSLGFIVVFGWSELWHNLFVIPSHHPLKGGWEIGGKMAWALALGCAPFVALLALLRERGVSPGGVSLLVVVAVVQLPLGVIGAWKLGGASNAFHSIGYFFVAVCWQLAGGSARRAVWLRVRAALLVAVLLPWSAWVVKQRDGWRLVPVAHLAASEELAREMSGEGFFPRNPLVTWWTDRKIYHFEYGFFDQAMAGYAPTEERMNAWLPRRMNFIVYPAGPIDHPFARLIPGFEKTIHLDGFVAHVAGTAAAKRKAPRE